jgi:hypothetical protein
MDVIKAAMTSCGNGPRFSRSDRTADLSRMPTTAERTNLPRVCELDLWPCSANANANANAAAEPTSVDYADNGAPPDLGAFEPAAQLLETRNNRLAHLLGHYARQRGTQTLTSHLCGLGYQRARRLVGELERHEGLDSKHGALDRVPVGPVVLDDLEGQVELLISSPALLPQ